MKTLASLFLVVCLAGTQASSAESVREINKAALDAHGRQDWPAYLESMTKLDTLRPNHPRVLFNLAGALARANRSDEALAMLERLAATGVVMPVVNDDDLALLRESPRFAAVVERMAKSAAPVGTAKPAATIDVKGALPEGVAWDAKSGTLFVSTVLGRAVFSVGRDGRATKLPIAEESLWSAMGMKVDSKRGLLWICSAATSMTPGIDPALEGRSALLAWDIRKGRLAARVELGGDGVKHWFGDLALDSKGNVYVSDTTAAAIYRHEPGSEAIALWLKDENFVNPQGLAFAGSDATLLVADYLTGLWTADTATKKLARVNAAPDVTLIGIDGLLFVKGGVIAVQNGITPQRLVRFAWDAKARSVTSWEALEANRPEFAELTLAADGGDAIYFIATSQWESFREDGTLKEGATPREIVVMRR
ncbi:MAG: SMP-30/gluconolactonase/LRE family protein [Acidobacteria bacterium]|nr:SMP-30/gluconolactonase/LRE family protein [Acidobacteriota bacterium]